MFLFREVYIKGIPYLSRMPEKSSSKQKKTKKSELNGNVDYSYITEDEIKNGFKPSSVPQEGIVFCPFCSTTNTTEDEFCFNYRKKLAKPEYTKKEE